MALPKTNRKKKKRLGRGYGSGKGGHTVGRGAKGFKARSKVGLTFAGTKIKKSLLKNLPLQRGKGKFKPLQAGPVVVNLKYLNLFSAGSVVDLKSLVKQGVVDAQAAQSRGVKILGDGELKIKLKVKLPCSQSAAKKIKKAGGEVVAEKKAEKIVKSKKKPPLKSKPKTKAKKPKTAK